MTRLFASLIAGSGLILAGSFSFAIITGVI
jgi:hypothetical protein